MPRFERLRSDFNDDPVFQMVLANVYADIIEFHRRAYKFFRRRGKLIAAQLITEGLINRIAWHLTFDSLWRTFDSRFHDILDRLGKHKTQLIDEAIVIDLVESRKWRANRKEDLKLREKKWAETYVHDTVAWLNIPGDEQENELDKLIGRRLVGTCEWIFRNSKFTSWRDDPYSEPILWIKGIPGAGTSLMPTFPTDVLTAL
jgi:hypothetical protein